MIDSTVDDPWDGAACRRPGVDAAWFFPSRGSTDGELAKRVCRSCPIQQKCGERVMGSEGQPGNRYRWGIWAGMTPRERARIARRRELGFA